MNENNLNANLEEVVQPQGNTGAENGEITNPQIDEMSDEDFESYINSAQNGDFGEVQAESYNTGIAEPADSDEKSEPFRVFNTQEEYQGEFDRIIGERLKKSREGMETLEGLKQQALNFYGTDDGDTALAQLIEDLQQQNAEKKGVSVEDYKKQSQDSIDAQKYRNEQSRKMYEQQRIADIQQRWQNESEELKRIIPDFDFVKAMANNEFYDSIVNGMSVSNAYLNVNMQNTSAMLKKRRGILQNGNMKGGSAGSVEANPASMTDRDFAKYIERIKG